MSDLVEKIARAIFEKFEDRPDYAKLQMNGVLAEELAKAALAALSAEGLVLMPREPTEAMITSGHAEGVRADLIWDRITYELASDLRQKYLPAAYHAMLAAAEKWDA